ncbi:hypothetical protein TSOC111612_21375 [Tsukamurella ocularis]
MHQALHRHRQERRDQHVADHRLARQLHRPGEDEQDQHHRAQLQHLAQRLPAGEAGARGDVLAAQVLGGAQQLAVQEVGAPCAVELELLDPVRDLLERADERVVELAGPAVGLPDPPQHRLHAGDADERAGHGHREQRARDGREVGQRADDRREVDAEPGDARDRHRQGADVLGEGREEAVVAEPLDVLERRRQDALRQPRPQPVHGGLREVQQDQLRGHPRHHHDDGGQDELRDRDRRHRARRDQTVDESEQVGVRAAGDQARDHRRGDRRGRDREQELEELHGVLIRRRSRRRRGSPPRSRRVRRRRPCPSTVPPRRPRGRGARHRRTPAPGGARGRTAARR